MMMLISLRRLFIILIMIKSAQFQFTWYDENEVGTQVVDAVDRKNTEYIADDSAHVALNTIDSMVEKVTSIIESNDFDITNEVFTLAHKFDIPYVSEVRRIYNTFKHLKNLFKSNDSLRIVKDAFNYVRDSPFVKAISGLKSLKPMCSKPTYRQVMSEVSYTLYSDLKYSCDAKVDADENIKDLSITTRFYYKCLDDECKRQQIYSPVIIDFDNEYHLRMTIDSYYRLSMKPNFYAMLLQLHAFKGEVKQMNSKANLLVSPADIQYLFGEMLDSCVVSFFLKRYHMTFLKDDIQPLFAVPGQLSILPRTRFYWYKGSHSFFQDHWRGREYWTGGMPDLCMRDYVDWPCPFFENCWD